MLIIIYSFMSGNFFCSFSATMIYNLRISLMSSNCDITTVRTCTSHLSHQADTGCRMIHSVHYSWPIHLYLSVEILSQLNNKRTPLFPSVSSLMLDFIERMPFGKNWSVDWFCVTAGLFCSNTHRYTVSVYKCLGITLPWTIQDPLTLHISFYFLFSFRPNLLFYKVPAF